MKYLSLILYFSLFTMAGAAKSYNVGVLYWSDTIEGQLAMRKGLEDTVTSLNQAALKNKRPQLELTTFVAGDGSNGIQNQLAQFYKLIAMKPDLIIVQPTDNAALSAPLKLANRKSIPVIAFDQYIIGGNLLSLITSNNYQAGYLNGEYIASLYPDSYEIKLILVEYPNVSSTIDRVDGFFDALKKEKQKFTVLKAYQAVNPIEGAAVGKEILKEFKETGSVDTIFAINDGGGLAIAQELVKAQRFEIKMATVDGDPKAIDLINEKGPIVIDSAQFCAEIGRQSAKKAYDFLEGRKISKKVLVPTFPVTQETLKLYSGWSGEIPKSFKKPWKESSRWKNTFKLKN